MPESAPEAERLAEVDFTKTAILRARSEAGDDSAVEVLRGYVSRWTKEGRPEDAAKLVEELQDLREILPPDLQQHFDNAAGEAYLYTSDFEQAEIAFSAVAKNKLPELPDDEKQISPEQKDAYSRTIHAQGRLADTAFLSGEYSITAEHYATQVLMQEKYSLEPAGSRACAQYGQAACALMEGDLQNCLELLAMAKSSMEEAVSDESVLLASIENLEATAEGMDEAPEDDREARIKAMKAVLMQRGGGKGGVKRINFRELYDEANAELEIEEE
jgi:enamine deaminase RidA (YjgF/YER057c/UK114 family)